jgi:hypothetical protein
MVDCLWSRPTYVVEGLEGGKSQRPLWLVLRISADICVIYIRKSLFDGHFFSFFLSFPIVSSADILPSVLGQGEFGIGLLGCCSEMIQMDCGCSVTSTLAKANGF